ncbi:desulfoferrodoxin FeS4 iron-binding domain-containing protein [candidate division WOR-3 bacterium]|jgi:superoxide reductase|nr:desulfoferrodoxin FeS4 iron-binding domain-containing protein [candidate division WOR-3 bacterium]MEA3311586.1 desulfoferrodoxin FeS4 iron-binding domain-containing protein [candidate division WOR-3 bacterium]
MAEEGKTYVCNICGQEVKVTKAGAGTLVCCGQDMEPKEGP